MNETKLFYVLVGTLTAIAILFSRVIILEIRLRKVEKMFEDK